MRLLALARYRFLIAIRKAGGLFAGIAVALLPFIIVTTRAFAPDGVYEQYVAVEALHFSAFWAPVLCVLQALALVIACLTLAMGSPRTAGARNPEPFELVPVSATKRFWGDAIGFFGAALLLHLSVLPLLAIAMALTPLSLGAFIYIEALTVAILLFGACTASWTLRASVSHANPAFVVLAILLAGIVILTSRLEQFREGLGQFFNQSDIRGLRVMVASFDSPAITAVLAALVYAGFIVFYHLHSVRRMEEA